MDAELGQWATTLGVGGALAAFMFMFYRKDILNVVNSQKEQISVLMSVVKENTVAITANTKTIEALHRRMDLDYPESGRRKTEP